MKPHIPYAVLRLGAELITEKLAEGIDLAPFLGEEARMQMPVVDEVPLRPQSNVNTARLRPPKIITTR